MTVISLAERISFIERVFGKGGLTRDGRNFDVRCPICAPVDRSKRKLSINTSNDLNQCWSCGWSARNLVPLVRRYGTPQDLKEYNERFVGHHEHFEVRIHERPKLPEDFTLLAFVEHDYRFRRIVSYLKSRGLDHDDFWRYRFGVSSDPEFANRVIFPSYDARGHLNYYVARSVERNVARRYKNPPVNRDDVIFNEMFVDWTQPLVLCEGPFDAVKCGDNVVPLLGNRLSERSLLFCKILESSTPIRVALDADMETRAWELANRLLTYDIDVKIVDIRPHKDPGDMARQDFALKLESAHAPTWRSDLARRLAFASNVCLNTGSR